MLKIIYITARGRFVLEMEVPLKILHCSLLAIFYVSGLEGKDQPKCKLLISHF